jgi:hypothetical protein
VQASVAELFPHIRIVMGMVIGLGITRLLMGVAGLVQHPARAKLSAIHLLWAASILVELTLFWWWEFALYRISDWSFGIFFFLIGYAVTLFMLAALLFPDKLDDYDGYEDFFLKRRHWFFSILATTFLLDVIDTLIKGEPYFDTLGLQYLVQVPLGLLLAVIAIRTANRTFHLGLVIAHLLYQGWWIYLLFKTHA